MQYKGVTDYITQPLWDTMQIPMAGTSVLTFFTIPRGGTVTAALGGGTIKSIVDTNMDLAGQLPGGFGFQVNGFRLRFNWNVVTADVIIAINASTFIFTVGQKDFLRLPACSLPSGSGVFVGGAGAITAGATSGWPTLANNFGIKGNPLVMGSTENFSATLNWSNGVQALSAAMFVQIILDGFLGRPVQ